MALDAQAKPTRLVELVHRAIPYLRPRRLLRPDVLSAFLCCNFEFSVHNQ
jgi:hypothetical protein